MSEKTPLDLTLFDLIVYRSDAELKDLLDAMGVTIGQVWPNVIDGRARVRLVKPDNPIGWAVMAISDPSTIKLEDVLNKTVYGELPFEWAEHALIVVTLRHNGDPAGRRSLGAYRVHRAA